MSDIILTDDVRYQRYLERRRERHRKYYKANTAKISSYNKQYFQANKERIYAQRWARREAKQKEGVSDD